MNCEQYQEYSSQFVDGELDRASESDLFRHLGSCEQCRTFLKNILSLRNTLTFSQLVTVPASLDQRVLNQSSLAMKQPMLHNFFFHKGKTQYSFRAIGLAVILSTVISVFVSSLWYTSQQPQRTIVCLTPLPEVEVNGYIVVATSHTKGINQ
jgi:predicted anti-sigma-YlaC factor YlaD